VDTPATSSHRMPPANRYRQKPLPLLSSFEKIPEKFQKEIEKFKREKEHIKTEGKDFKFEKIEHKELKHEKFEIKEKPEKFEKHEKEQFKAEIKEHLNETSKDFSGEGPGKGLVEGPERPGRPHDESVQRDGRA